MNEWPVHRTKQRMKTTRYTNLLNYWKILMGCDRGVYLSPCIRWPFTRVRSKKYWASVLSTFALLLQLCDSNDCKIYTILMRKWWRFLFSHSVNFSRSSRRNGSSNRFMLRGLFKLYTQRWWTANSGQWDDVRESLFRAHSRGSTVRPNTSNISLTGRALMWLFRYQLLRILGKYRLGPRQKWKCIRPLKRRKAVGFD